MRPECLFSQASSRSTSRALARGQDIYEKTWIYEDENNRESWLLCQLTNPSENPVAGGGLTLLDSVVNVTAGGLGASLSAVDNNANPLLSLKVFRSYLRSKRFSDALTRIIADKVMFCKLARAVRSF